MPARQEARGSVYKGLPRRGAFKACTSKATAQTHVYRRKDPLCCVLAPFLYLLMAHNSSTLPAGSGPNLNNKPTQHLSYECRGANLRGNKQTVKNTEADEADASILEEVTLKDGG